MNLKPTLGIILFSILTASLGYDKLAWQATSQKIKNKPIEKIINLINI